MSFWTDQSGAVNLIPDFSDITSPYMLNHDPSNFSVWLSLMYN